ncbi:MAG: transposase [Chitinispirillaceae bacterium]|nr:transposase [Chitinispirillaceae bacterium]
MENCYFVADAYYANKTIIRKLLKSGCYQLVTRVRSNAVAWYSASSSTVKRRGHKNKYGKKIKLKSLFDDMVKFTETPSPVYGEKNKTLSYRSIDLYGDQSVFLCASFW